jgi:hypothetical protein
MATKPLITALPNMMGAQADKLAMAAQAAKLDSIRRLKLNVI